MVTNTISTNTQTRIRCRPDCRKCCSIALPNRYTYIPVVEAGHKSTQTRRNCPHTATGRETDDCNSMRLFIFDYDIVR